MVRPYSMDLWEQAVARIEAGESRHKVATTNRGFSMMLGDLVFFAAGAIFIRLGFVEKLRRSYLMRAVILSP